MLTEQQIKDILKQIDFPDFKFLVEYESKGYEYYGHYVEDGGQYPYLVIECNGTDNFTGKPWKWRSRKWKLSEHMVPTEIVQTAFKATLVALEHEAREQFMYKGVPVFDSHIDIEKLVELRKNPECLSVRT